MLFPIAFSPDPAGGLCAVVPDLGGQPHRAATGQALLPMVRLAIEDALTRRLLAGEPLPDTRGGTPPAAYSGPPGLRWLTIHINLDHLRALAAHQRGRA